MGKYRGYPQYVVIAFPKSGTKTLNKVFTCLGYKVFDAMHLCDYAIPVCSMLFKPYSVVDI